jgi:hypothetical protein
MSDLRRAAEMALDALNEVTGWQWSGPMWVMDEVEDAIQALRTALAQPEQWKTCRHCGFDYRPPKANKWFPLAQQDKECVYPKCETAGGCDGPCGEKPVDTINTSQERETAKRGHEPVAWHEPGAYGNVTTHKDWALANGWEPLYKEKNT